MNEQAEKLRREAAAMKRKADAISHTPLTEEQWNSFEGDVSPVGCVDVLKAWNESFARIFKQACSMRAEALYWREKYEELMAPSEISADE